MNKISRIKYSVLLYLLVTVSSTTSFSMSPIDNFKDAKTKVLYCYFVYELHKAYIPQDKFQKQYKKFEWDKILNRIWSDVSSRAQAGSNIHSHYRKYRAQYAKKNRLNLNEARSGINKQIAKPCAQILGQFKKDSSKKRLASTADSKSRKKLKTNSKLVTKGSVNFSPDSKGNTAISKIKHSDERAGYCYYLYTMYIRQIGRDRKNAYKGKAVIKEFKELGREMKRVLPENTMSRVIPKGLQYIAEWVSKYKKNYRVTGLAAEQTLVRADIKNCRYALAVLKKRKSLIKYAKRKTSKYTKRSVLQDKSVTVVSRSNPTIRSKTELNKDKNSNTMNLNSKVVIQKSNREKIKSSTSKSVPLYDRFLPAGKLLYSDRKGSYYGIYTNVYWGKYSDKASRRSARHGLHPNYTRKYFRVIAFRKPDRQGRIFNYQKITSKNGNGEAVKGYTYAQAEIDFMNKMILPAVNKYFPDRENKYVIEIFFYIKDQYYKNNGANRYMSTIGLNKPELPLFAAAFSRKRETGLLKPLYELHASQQTIDKKAINAIQNDRVDSRFVVIGVIPTIEHALKNRIALSSSILKNRRRLVKDSPLYRHKGKQKGIVYKTDEFWERLDFPDIVQSIFSGDFSSNKRSVFKVYYHAIHTAYSYSCKNYYPKTWPVRGFLTKNIRSGNIVGKDLFYIDPRYIVKFDEYHKEIGPIYAAMKRHMTGDAMRDVKRGKNIFKSLAHAKSQMPTAKVMQFIRATGCQTAALKQLRENFHRAATSRLSLQKAKVILKKAEAESKAPTVKSMYKSCMRKKYSDPRYCLCFEKNAKKIMTRKEYNYFRVDFSRYYTDVQKRMGQRLAPPAHDRVWQLYKIFSSCAR